MSNQFCAPVLRRADGTAVSLERLPLGTEDYSEKVLQDLLFAHPSLLPVEEIDNAFVGLVPICTELPTTAGRIDALYVTPAGRLAFVETKLWRNPEARREVVAQVVDYAAELGTWSLEGLDAAVRHRTGRRLFDIVRTRHPETDEAAFCDGVAKCLRAGQFLLLVCGDGIRQGTEKIATFLNQRTSLDFTFALVEMAIYGGVGAERVIQGRILARTERIERVLHRFRGEEELLATSSPEEGEDSGPDSEAEARLSARREFWLSVWTEVERAIRFEDAQHMTFKPERRENAAGLWGSRSTYLLSYFSTSERAIGVAMSMDANGGREVFDALREDRESIEAELGRPLRFTLKSNGRSMAGLSHPYRDPSDPEQRAEAVLWFARAVEDFDRVLRPRIQVIESS